MKRFAKMSVITLIACMGHLVQAESNALKVELSEQHFTTGVAGIRLSFNNQNVLPTPTPLHVDQGVVSVHVPAALYYPTNGKTLADIKLSLWSEGKRLAGVMFRADMLKKIKAIAAQNNIPVLNVVYNPQLPNKMDVTVSKEYVGQTADPEALKELDE